MIEYLATLPDYVVAKLADRQLGIATQSSYLPTIADIKAFADRVLEDRARDVRYADIQARRMTSEPVRVPFRPFPKLWAAFADDPEALDKLDHPDSFDFLNEASKRLATRGKDSARVYICPQPVDTRATSSEQAP